MDQEARILNLATEGLRAKKIAAALEIPLTEVVKTLTKAIEERTIKRSQVLDTLEGKWQEELLAWVPAWSRKGKVSLASIHEMLKESNLNAADVERIRREHGLPSDYEFEFPAFDLSVEELGLYLMCFEKPFRGGEIYEALCEIERTLHAKIKAVLMEAYGHHWSEWWRNGVHEDIRQRCVEAWEEEPDFVEYPPYHKTTLGQLGEIIQSAKNPKREKMKLFETRLPLGQNGRDPVMEVFKKDFRRLVTIRNKVMHPIGASLPSEDDFFFVREMQGKLDITKWR